jgi:pyruvate,water dikinase
MRLWGSTDRTHAPAEDPAGRIRAKYRDFRDLLAANNESLELMAGLQEDLQFTPPRRSVLGDRIGTIFGRVGEVVAAFRRLTGLPQPVLTRALAAQQSEVERFSASFDELARPRMSAWLSEVHAGRENEAGSKAAVLGEIRNKLGLPVPEGFVLTTEAYRRYCGIPLWTTIRDGTRDADINDLEAVRAVAESLQRAVLAAELPRAIEVAVEGRAETLLKDGGSLAVRSSARGEGGARSYAGQFLSLLNVPARGAVEAYKRVIAGRFSEQAVFYRLSAGLLEVDNPMAVLFLRMIPARAAGILYTRDPADSNSTAVWVTATRGLGLEIASGRMPADLFLVSRSRPHVILERNIVEKEEELVQAEGEGLAARPLLPGARNSPSLQDGDLHTLAEWAVLIEEHFRTPQDIEWVLDLTGRLWIVQSRPLANVDRQAAKPQSRPKSEPRAEGGRTIYPGRTSGPAFLVQDPRDIGKVPPGSVVFIRKPSPEIVEVFPRICGLVAEWGNVAGHAAALLREFQIPSVFQMSGAFGRVANGEPVSLDAVQVRLYSGTLWPPVRRESVVAERYSRLAGDPIGTRLLTLNLLDPTATNFRPADCKSAHDVLRYCHEKAIEAMFEINDRELEAGAVSSRRLETSLPMHFYVLDLGGGIAPGAASAKSVAPAAILSRPFQALWQGITHPAVTWVREMPASLGDFASVLATALTPQEGGMRALGERSYLLVAADYLNLNSRLAYHYSLVDACLSGDPASNYISFRFEGGGAARQRRTLRARFLERCLVHYGFRADRRADLVNAWFRKAPADQTAERLDILGRLLACSSQLDMYMDSREAMNWFTEQFIRGNYAFRKSGQDAGLQ